MRGGDFILIPAGTAVTWDEFDWRTYRTVPRSCIFEDAVIGYARDIRDGSVEWTKPYEDRPVFVSPAKGIEVLPQSCYIVTDEAKKALFQRPIEEFVAALSDALAAVGVAVRYVPKSKEKGLMGGLEDLRGTCGEIVMRVLWG